MMKQRWQQSNQMLPDIDKIDIINESPFLNEAKIEKRHQHHPEFTHSSYLRLRSQEEAFAMRDYLSDKISDSTASKASGLFKRVVSSSQLVSNFDRSYAI
jgi:hypothetical protein